MRPGDDPQDPAHELRVTDKRRFTATGDIREESDAEPQAATPEPEPARAPAPPPSPATEAPEPAAPSGRSESAYDLGIESVFLIFHQSALIALGATHPGGTPGRVDL